MIITKLAGTTFQKINFPLSVGDRITIKRETGSTWDTDGKPAYAVILDGCRIGYIPLVETVKKLMLDARREGNNAEYSRKFEECNVLIYIRDCIYTDLERNNIIPDGTIASLRWQNKTGQWSDTAEDGALKGISISLNYD